VRDPAISGIHGHASTRRHRGSGAEDTASAGIPSEGDFVSAYCRRAGRGPVAAWPYFLAFSLFRAAAILAGVYRRALDGNAADANALTRGASYREVAELGWSIARSA
jgi:aminoglycoside phosphotransferase (APT) family kinase protein